MMTILPKACQCCLRSKKLIDMMTPALYRKTYVELLSYTFSLVPRVETNLRSWICEECAAQLIKAYELRSQFNNAQDKLKHIREKYVSRRASKIGLTVEEGDCETSTEVIFETSFVDDATFDDETCEFAESTKIASKKAEYECAPVKLTDRSGVYEVGVVDLREVDFVLAPADETTTDGRKRKHPRRKLDTTTEDLKKRVDRRLHNIQSRPYFVGESQSNCNECGKAFASREALIRHVASHYPLFACDVCGRAFATKTQMRTHIIRIHDERRSPCPVCGKQIKSVNMKSHLKGHERGPERKAIPCAHCAATFPNYKRRAAHLLRDHGIDVYHVECGVCAKKFLTRGKLNEHTRLVHLREKRAACAACGKRFASGHMLRRHWASMHADEKRFACDACPPGLAVFKSLWALQKHRRLTHRPQNVAATEGGAAESSKRYPCLTCGARFDERGALERHLTTAHVVREERATPAARRGRRDLEAETREANAAASMITAGLPRLAKKFESRKRKRGASPTRGGGDRTPGGGSAAAADRWLAPTGFGYY